MSNKKTSPEWLMLQLYEQGLLKGDGNKMDELLDQAKSMHKEETIGFTADWSVQWKYEDGKSIIQYYNETFTK